MSSELASRLMAPVSDLGLAIWRIALGALVILFVLADWNNVIPQLVQVRNHFTYDGFTWVAPLSATLMQGVYVLLGMVGACLVLGLATRVAAALAFVGLAYVFLIEQARYSTNIYLLILSCLLLALLPRIRSLALQARLTGDTGARSVPQWAVWAVMLLAAVPLVYGGLYRLSPDWLSGWPLKLWFPGAAPRHWLGPEVSALLVKKGFSTGWAWAVLVAHLAAVPMLLHRYTRWLAFSLLVGVFVGYSLIFKKVIFPFPLFAALMVFIPGATWARMFRLGDVQSAASEPGVAAGPAAGGVSAALVAILLAFHVVFPARSLVYQGQAAWSGDGYRFSWRDMLHDRYCEARFTIQDPVSGQKYIAAHRLRLPGFQHGQVRTRPDMMLQYAYFLEEQYRVEFKIDDPRVFLKAKCSLNTRPFAEFADPRLDLTTVQRSWGATPWVKPLEHQMPPGWLRSSMKKPFR